ncbi:hypothetical protein [Massilia sp. S19_KUP03_FR1]|uniref:hypothetical protein n=1 Tax=Massilia sp. S19_KUP03_FR1 TaxID=3025503 RepID=UPI002FCDB9C6
MLRPPVHLRLALAALFTSTLLAAPWALAEPEPGAPREVVVKDIRAPELKTYRAMLAGLDTFEDEHALAPAAPEVRFRLRAKSGNPDADLDDLKLRIALNEGSIPLPLAADHSFVLPRNEQARKENGDLLLNKHEGAYRWQADVFSAGVPTNMRRLGDLRLECRVEVAVIKAEVPFWVRALVNSILLTSDWCGVEKVHFSTNVPRKLKAAWLIQGEKRIALELSDFGMGYEAPAGDKAYPDDTLIALEYADESKPGADAP